ncbi:sodium:solute symporter family protein [Aquirhabdus parva]|uniref:Sodium:solute symporter n=1 Tax=Aquirhabdus parva TaxID=2283318 RepID=A0A345P5K5_9GAMM|nr:sodium:solute symporter family protein [Aquirhabdus parva]AXI02564.1 sodium:solute symporter [Aquirhabdus parva]
MLFGFVIAYWVISVAIGLWAGRLVHNARDFAIAGRNLPFYVVTATVFATWFGSETVLGIPATFLQGGLNSIVADPFGASLCLILVGLFFAAPLYRMKLLTIGDFYKLRYGRKVEFMTTIAIVISYLGWVGAQITALGLVFNLLSDGAITNVQGMWIGSITILIYTFFGGMWAVAITDFIQMIVIVLGMLWIGGEISGQVGGVGVVAEHAWNAGKFNFWPEHNFAAIAGFIAAWCTMMFGSIPQQDVFQRVQSAKTIKIAVWATVLGGVMYFVFAFIPMFLAYSATLLDPHMVSSLIDSEPQKILPTLVMTKAPLIAQILFFGALLSAIKSCASATLLAPSVTFTENILKPMFPKMTDKQLLRNMRIVTVCFTIIVTLYAMHSKASIFKMVENAYQVTLVAAFIPLLCGVYWSKATNQGALFAVVMGLVTWITMLIGPAFVEPLQVLTPQGVGVIASALGMLIGSLIPQYASHDPHIHHKLRTGQHLKDQNVLGG